MKTIFFILFAFASLAAIAQEPVKPVELDFWGNPKDASSSGDNLTKAANLHFASVFMYGVGAGMVAGGQYFSQPEVSIAGGVVCFSAFICDVAAWCKIKKAGRMLNRQKK